MLRVKRIYEPPEPDDGMRILVDRLWPRGVDKDEAKLDLWLKDVAPSDGLRKWFAHDPEKWPEFESRYAEELADKDNLLRAIRVRERLGRVTLLYSAKDQEHNNALALKAYLEGKLTPVSGGGPRESPGPSTPPP